MLTILITSVCAKCDSGCTLDCFPHTVRRLVAFYVNEHNGVLPHSAFRGQTPDEMQGLEALAPPDPRYCLAATGRAVFTDASAS